MESDCVVLSTVRDLDFIIYIRLFENFKDSKNKVTVVCSFTFDYLKYITQCQTIIFVECVSWLGTMKFRAVVSTNIFNYKQNIRRGYDDKIISPFPIGKMTCTSKLDMNSSN